MMTASIQLKKFSGLIFVKEVQMQMQEECCLSNFLARMLINPEKGASPLPTSSCLLIRTFTYDIIYLFDHARIGQTKPRLR